MQFFNVHSCNKNFLMIVLMCGIMVFVGCGEQIVSVQYPLPEQVENLVSHDDGASASFQTSAKLQDILMFYRNAFIAQGLQENTALAVQDETMFSVVFSGHASGQALVVQAVVLSPEKINVNIRLEKL